MKDRIIELRKSLGLNQTDFGKPLNLSRSAIATYELGTRALTERTISDICRVYNVNYTWLIYGSGKMFSDIKDIDVELDGLTAVLCDSGDDWVKQCIIKFLRLTPQAQNAFKDFILDLANAITLSGDNGNSKYDKLPYIPLDK